MYAFFVRRLFHFTKTVLIISVFSSLCKQVLSTCPLNYNDIGTKCMREYRGSRHLNYREAVSACSIMNSKLLEINDEYTQSEVARWLRGMPGQSYWIGLHNGRWQNGSIPQYTSWAEEFPQRENCVVLSGDRGFNWIEIDCSQKHLFICEIPHHNRISDILRRRNFPLTFELQEFCHLVPLGYYAYPMDCKKYVLCFAPYSNHNSIYSCGSKQYYNHRKRRCERPLKDFQCIIQATTTYTTTVVMTTSTTQPLTTLTTTRPSTTDDIYDLGPYGEYDDTIDIEVPTSSDDQTKYYPTNETPSSPENISLSPYECEDQDYVLFRDACYVIRDVPMPWVDARLLCAPEGGQLAVIKSKDEQMFLETELKKQKYVYYHYWIGLTNAKKRGKFVWVDDTPLEKNDYNNWHGGPSDGRGMQECVVMTEFYRYQWDGSICSNKRPYICQKGAVKKQETEYFVEEDAHTEQYEDENNYYLDVDGNENYEYAAPNDPLMIPPLKPIAPMKPRNEYCGNTRKPGVGKLGAVIGGKVASKNTHPWQVSLRLGGEHMCGGSLIDDCWVLTAAHCVDERTTGARRQPTVVVAGDHDMAKIEGTEQYLLIKDIFIHPIWKFDNSPKNDIALIQLKVCAKDLNPICLPHDEFDRFGAGSYCKISGWGTMDPRHDVTPTELQEALVPIIDQNTCERAYMEGSTSLITDNMLCAGYMKGNVDACDGDSGGPLGCVGVHSPNMVQWGIVSWGHGCAQANQPGVYTKVVNFMDWVRETTNIDY